MTERPPETPPLIPPANGLLGRVRYHDPNNRSYPMRALMGEAIVRRNVTWWRRGVFDQGNTSSCTAHAATGLLVTSPFRMSTASRPHLPAYDTFEERVELYRKAQTVDPWPGESYEGSSTDAPFKILRERGHIREWRWCFGVNDVLDTLSAYGPVAVGTNWYRTMFQADPITGRVTIEGSVAGGHAYQLIGISVRNKTVTAVNSWGEQFGVRGRFVLTWDQLGKLLEDDGGEACTVVL